MIRQKFPKFLLFKGGNLWWAGSLQFLIDRLSEMNPDPNSLVLTINDDVEIPETYLETAVRVMNANENIFLGSVCLTDSETAPPEHGVDFDLKSMEFKVSGPNDKINCMATRGLFFRWKDLKTVGGFLPKLLPHYFSDYEFTIRAHRAGFVLKSDSSLWLRTSKNISGEVSKKGAGFFPTLKYIFSNLNRTNPLHLSIFIFLSAPGIYKILNQSLPLRVLYSQLKQGLKPWQSLILDSFTILPYEGLRWLKQLPRRILKKVIRIVYRRNSRLDLDR